MLSKVRSGKICQSALRHKVRNLRAKVRLLLPTQLCTKDRRRTKNIQKILRNRGQGPEWYLPTSSIKEHHMFQKLTQSEIEQIKQDKLYYLGEEFLQQFNKFLEKEHGVKEWSGRLATAGSSIPQVPLKINYSHTPLFHKTTSSNFSSLFHDGHSQDDRSNDKQNRKAVFTTNTLDRKTKNLMRFQSIKQKRKIIKDQQKTKNVMIRHKIEEREKKRQENYSKMTAQRQRYLREKNQVNQLRTTASFRIRRSRQGLGQISQLSQKLRGLCLQQGVKQTN